jgi:oligoribonuclease
VSEVSNLFWLDLEMTGLGDEQVILEIASLVTGAELNILAEGPEIAVHRTAEEISRMEAWPAVQHKNPGYSIALKLRERGAGKLNARRSIF